MIGKSFNMYDAFDAEYHPGWTGSTKLLNLSLSSLKIQHFQFYFTFLSSLFQPCGNAAFCWALAKIPCLPTQNNFLMIVSIIWIIGGGQILGLVVWSIGKQFDFSTLSSQCVCVSYSDIILHSKLEDNLTYWPHKRSLPQKQILTAFKTSDS